MTAVQLELTITVTPREFNADAAAAVLSALRSARDHGSAEAALRANGVDLPGRGVLEGVSDELEALLACSAADSPLREALALGYLLAPRRPPGAVAEQANPRGS